MKILCVLPIFLAVVVVDSIAAPAEPADEEVRCIKQRYLDYLTGTEEAFQGSMGANANREFLHRIKRPIRDALAFDFTRDAGKPFRAFPGEPGYKDEVAVFSPLLQRALPALAFGYCVKGIDNPHYRNPGIQKAWLRCLEYLRGRGIREGMTFHNNANRMRMDGAPRPPAGAANLAEMELRMGSLCQSVLLMEPHIREAAIYLEIRALVRHLEMLGRTSGHVRYYEPGENPPAFPHRVQSDAIQNFADTTLVSALLETDPERQAELLTEAGRVYSDSLKIIPGWADTIKPDHTGYHKRSLRGEGLIPRNVCYCGPK